MSQTFPAIPSLDWDRFRAVLFDVDGTLYDQKRMRKIMALELVLFCLTHPHRVRHAMILSKFRRLREERFECEDPCLMDAQYRWTAEAAGAPVEKVRQIADEWLLRRPLKHLPRCRPDGLAELFLRLRLRGRKIGVFSDYPVEAKLRALGLQADAESCATDAHVNRFKPHPAGLRHLCERLNVKPAECLHIGDREDRDAVCARNLGCESLILPAHRAVAMGARNSYDLLFPG